MRAARSLTLLWPGLPWLWLRGGLMGLVLACAFAIVLDVAVITTWIWCELMEPPVVIGAWTATAVIFVAATFSAVKAFPPPLHIGRDPAADALFATARDAYLARDWTTAEATLRTLLARAPTDGEAQLLLGTLLRRVGRLAEARNALEQLSGADSGVPWRAEIDRELARITHPDRSVDDADEPASLPLPARQAAATRHDAAA